MERDDKQILGNAKTLRSNQTDAEARLWYHLRAHRFMGLKFKRQKPLGRYIVDFVCVERRLIIELDGGQHAEQVTYDQQRDAWLRSQGYTVLRFWNSDVMLHLEGVLERIRCTLITEPSPPAPPPQVGEGSVSTPAIGEGSVPPLFQGEGQGEESIHSPSDEAGIPSPFQGEG